MAAAEVFSLIQITLSATEIYLGIEVDLIEQARGHGHGPPRIRGSVCRALLMRKQCECRSPAARL